MPENTWAIGIDFGATKIEVAGVDRKGRLMDRLMFTTNVTGGYDKVGPEIIQAIRKLLKTADSKPAGVGVGMAGQIDPSNGMVIFSPNLDWHNVPLQDALAQELGLPVAVTNDVRAAAWGEWLYGAGRGYHDLVCVFVGTGVGGGIVSNGRMLEGCSNTAGEIGHITIDLNGPPCHCSNHGCLESLAGGWAIARDAQEAVARDRTAGAVMLRLANGDQKAITAKIVSMAAHQNDTLASEIVKNVSNALVAGMAGLVNAFNPCVLILGGGVIEGLPELVSIIDSGVRSRALGAASKKLKVVHAELQRDAGVVGAAAFAIHTFPDKSLQKNG